VPLAALVGDREMSCRLSAPASSGCGSIACGGHRHQGNRRS
jgi:hypothetical protein